MSGATSLDCTCGILNELVRKCNRSRPACKNNVVEEFSFRKNHEGETG